MDNGGVRLGGLAVGGGSCSTTGLGSAQQVGGSSALLTRTRWAPISGSHIAPISIVIINWGPKRKLLSTGLGWFLLQMISL